jgi:endonuclease I
MRRILLSFFLLSATWSMAQGPYCTAPASYYNGLTGLTCNQLKAALYGKISTGYEEQAYGSFWASFEKTDKRRNDANTKDIVWDMYTDKPAATGECEYVFVTNQDNGSQPGNAECQAFNREHSMPKSWFGGDVEPMYTDMFEIIPADKYLNSEHANYPYGEVNAGAGGTKTYNNGTRLGQSSVAGVSGLVFEPIDAYKGDVARGYLYMITRYHNIVAGWDKLDPNGDRALDGKQYPGFEIPYLKMLLKWHHADPVSQKEINRNNAIYCIQKNRNPFIDHPEYVDLVWNSNCSGAEALPVDLISFKGLLAGNHVKLFWEVANERNLKQYIVERSVNGKDFVPAGTLVASGQSTYQFNDDVSKLTGRRLYYRLKQVDINGDMKYSQVFTVHIPLNNLFSIVQNPASNRLRLQLYQPVQHAMLQIIDMAGRVQMQQSITQGAGVGYYDISKLSPGAYFVKIIYDNQSHLSRLEIIK